MSKIVRIKTGLIKAMFPFDKRRNRPDDPSNLQNVDKNVRARAPNC